MANIPSAFELVNNSGTNITREQVKSHVDEYYSLFSESTDKTSRDKRKEHYMKMVNNFYDLVTDFYEYGWGQSFHFAPRFVNETFDASIARSEHFLAAKLNLHPGMKVLDVGCGVGGPMRCIARFSGASIVGINNNEYQIKRGTRSNIHVGLDNICSFIKSDFMKLSVPDASMDAAYQIEATAHAPNKAACYRNIGNTLKPGSLFASYEWAMTPLFDPSNDEHQKIKRGIEVGNSLPDIATFAEINKALEDAGFEILEAFDANANAHSPHEIAWYQPLDGSFSVSGFRQTRLGQSVTHNICSWLEYLSVAPKGTTEVSHMLMETAKDLVRGGKTGIFTPSYFTLARWKGNREE